ncbi:MAG: iron-sulfur cluster assembly accessory protein [Planctomycetes bacterium]|nr:iron-sulfur cluster assembly accessory protein [Planctomycetota bacterium]
MAVILTESAATEVRRIMDEQKLEDGSVLRMGVAGGGCSGIQYTLGFDQTYDGKVDADYEYHGVKVVTMKKFALHLDGTTIDFQDGPTGRGFAIDNPNQPSGGGCSGCGGH